MSNTHNRQNHVSVNDDPKLSDLEMNKPDLTLDGAIPLFPLGPPRSGTTIVARILNAHPRILMTNETAVFLMLKDNIDKSRLGAQAGILYGKEHNELWANHLEQEARRLIESYYEKIKQVEGKVALKYWGEKHPHHCNCLDFLTLLYPGALFIQIIRDPRDTSCSIADMLQVDFQEALVAWKIFADIYDEFFRNIESERFLTLYYEELVKDYVGVSRRIFKWLGLEYVEEVDQYLHGYKHIDAQHFDSPYAYRKDFAHESVGRWKQEITGSDCEFANDLVGEHLDRYGYPRNN